jgi:hypothetical protein
MAAIEHLTGIKRSPVQVRKYLHRIGVQRCKVGVLPAKADVQAQETFKTQELEPRLAEAQAGQRAVFFVDAAHFVLVAYIGYLWSFVRVFVKTPSGRQRFNVLHNFRWKRNLNEFRWITSSSVKPWPINSTVGGASCKIAGKFW